MAKPHILTVREEYGGFFPVNRAREWIHCNEAYRRGLTGKGVGVAILDTGGISASGFGKLRLRISGFP